MPLCLLGWIVSHPEPLNRISSFENGCGAGVGASNTIHTRVCVCVCVDCTLMALNSHQSQASLMIFELWPPQTLMLQCHGERDLRHTRVQMRRQDDRAT